MAGRWIDEWRAEGSRRGPDRERERYEGAEDRAFGPRETGLGYNQARGEAEGDFRTDYRGHEYRPAWQGRDYEGVSPGFRQQEADYEREHPRFQTQDYTRGGRFYGDDGRGRTYREEYGYGEPPARRFGSAEADARYERALRRPGSGRYAGEPFEERAREAGEFFRRQGRRVAGWFNDIGREDQHDYAADRDAAYRGARGLGPKGYKRSDERINDDVHQHLTDDPWLDATGIDVAVADGEVTLSGTVVTRDAKHRAEHLVEDLSGVTHVQNNLRVRQASSYNPMRSEGDAAMETSANATHTTTRKS